MTTRYCPRTSALAAAAAAAVACALALTSCGSSSGSGSKAEEEKSPTQVFADAKSALFNAGAVHVAGTLSSQGTSDQLDLQLQDEDTAGSLTEAGQKVQIVKTGGSLYLNAPAAFWTKTLGAKGAALGGRWITVSAAQAGDVSQLTLQGIAASLDAADSPLTEKTARTSLDGQQAIVVSQKDGSQLFVADSTTPVPLRAVNHGSSQGTITFTDYGKRQTITAPQGAVTPQQAASSAGSKA